MRKHVLDFSRENVGLPVQVIEHFHASVRLRESRQLFVRKITVSINPIHPLGFRFLSKTKAQLNNLIARQRQGSGQIS